MRRKNGFTIIEVLVAVVIIGILAAISSARYTASKRAAEYKGMRGIVKSVAAAAKNYYMATNNYVSTSSTANTNGVYGTTISDTGMTFRNYRVGSWGSSSFRIYVVYSPSGGGSATASYTFDSLGDQIGCSGADCLS